MPAHRCACSLATTEHMPADCGTDASSHCGEGDNTVSLRKREAVARHSGVMSFLKSTKRTLASSTNRVVPLVTQRTAEKRTVFVFSTVVPITKLLAWGEGDCGGHALRDTTSRGLRGLVCPGTQKTLIRSGEDDEKRRCWR